MKTAVLYKSISGFTKTYAQWIAEELHSDLYSIEEVSPTLLSQYDLIVFGGSLHMVGIAGYKKLQKWLQKTEQPPKLVLFTTGASPQKEEAIEEVRNANLTPEEQKYIPFFYLRGGFDFDKLDLLNKVIMTLLKWKLKMTKNKTVDEIGMLNAYYTPMDFTRKEHLDELLREIKTCQTE